MAEAVRRESVPSTHDRIFRVGRCENFPATGLSVFELHLYLCSNVDELPVVVGVYNPLTESTSVGSFIMMTAAGVE